LEAIDSPETGRSLFPAVVPDESAKYRVWPGHVTFVSLESAVPLRCHGLVIHHGDAFSKFLGIGQVTISILSSPFGILRSFQKLPKNSQLAVNRAAGSFVKSLDTPGGINRK